MKYTKNIFLVGAIIVVGIITIVVFQNSNSDAPLSVKTTSTAEKNDSSGARPMKKTSIEPISQYEPTSLSPEDADFQLAIALYRNSEGVKRYQLKKNNHNRLLTTHQELIQYYQVLKDGTPGYSPYSPEVRSWAITLYKDALATRLEEQPLSNEERGKIQEILQSTGQDIDLSLLQTSSPHLPEKYLARLRKLLTVVFEDDSESVSKLDAATTVTEIADLLKRRKRYSNNYFQTNIKYYLTDSSISMQKKIALMQHVLETRDQSLTWYAKGYFLEAEQNGDLSAEEIEILTNLWRSYDVVD